MFTPDAPKQNHIIAALSPVVYQRLLPRLKAVTLRLGMRLFSARSNLRYVYFPTTSIVSLSYRVERGVMAKAWPVGNEGIVGISAFLDGSAAASQAEVEFSGGAFQLDTETLRAEFRRGAELQKLLLRYVDALLAQASQLGVCGHYHSIDQRLNRFLLCAFDRMSTDKLDITQARIARLLGARRGGITVAAQRLHQAGIIDYRRGQIFLLRRQELEARTCVCYVVIRDAFKALRRKRKPTQS